MSSEGFRGVSGVPDGWELVAIRKARYMENYIWTSGYTSLWQDSEESDFVVPIIRKIEQPDRYRALANSKEAEPFWDEALKLAKPCGQSANTRFRICVMTDKGIRIGLDFYSYAIAFERFVCADGTPFGAKIDE